MARLPNPGGDDNTWGSILNDFLSVSHDSDGTLKADAVDSSNIQSNSIGDTQVSSLSQSKITGLVPTLSAKAADSAVVHNTGNESVDGIKTFTSSPVVPTPGSGTQAANKAYVDGVVGGGVTDGDKGDITVSGSGSTWTVDNDTVTYAKMQNVSATDRFLGRDTAGAGDVEEIAPAAARTILNVADGATANSSDATLLNRANHTGTQTASTISDFGTATDARIAAATGTSIQAHDTDLDAIAGLTPTNDDLLQRKAGAWTNRTPAQVKTDLVLTKTDVGLGNVDNTSDANKPISTATSIALSGKAANTVTVTGTTSLAGGGDLTANRTLSLVNDSATPGNSQYYGTNGGGTKGYFALPAGAADATTSSKGIVQLAGDLAGTATLPTVPGLATKEPTITGTTSADYYRGDKTFQPLNKTAVGLANVDNTSDANKPISTATQTALNGKTALPTFVTVGVDQANTTQVFANITGLALNVGIGTYEFDFQIPYTGSTTATTLNAQLTGPTTSYLFYTLGIQNTNTTRGAYFRNAFSDPQNGGATASITTQYMLSFTGRVTTTASGVLQPQFCNFSAATTVTVKAGMYGRLQAL